MRKLPKLMLVYFSKKKNNFSYKKMQIFIQPADYILQNYYICGQEHSTIAVEKLRKNDFANVDQEKVYFFREMTRSRSCR